MLNVIKYYISNVFVIDRLVDLAWLLLIIR
jgi:hypothetical protein